METSGSGSSTGELSQVQTPDGGTLSPGNSTGPEPSFGNNYEGKATQRQARVRWEATYPTAEHVRVGEVCDALGSLRWHGLLDQA